MALFTLPGLQLPSNSNRAQIASLSYPGWMQSLLAVLFHMFIYYSCRAHTWSASDHRGNTQAPSLLLLSAALHGAAAAKKENRPLFVHQAFQCVRVPDIHRACLRSNFRSGVTKRRELSARLMSVWAAPQEQKQAASLLFRIYPAVFLSFECVVSVKRDKYASLISTPYAQIILWRKTYRYIFSSDIEMCIWKGFSPPFLSALEQGGGAAVHISREQSKNGYGRGTLPW